MKEAAAALMVDETTLKTFLRRARAKLGVRTRAELLLLHQRRHRSFCQPPVSSLLSSE